MAADDACPRFDGQRAEDHGEENEDGHGRQPVVSWPLRWRSFRSRISPGLPGLSPREEWEEAKFV
jgi:hypothetical protein